MNPLLYTIPLLAAAYMGASDAQDLPPLTDKSEKTIPETDPVSGNVWDRKAREWVPLAEFLRRVRIGQTYRIAEQVPLNVNETQSGLQVLADRQEAVRRHWQHVFEMREMYGLR